MIHELKILPEYFEDVISGRKTFEIRKNDRPFKKGDLLALNEHDGKSYTGNSCVVYVDYLTDDAELHPIRLRYHLHMRHTQSLRTRV